MRLYPANKKGKGARMRRINLQKMRRTCCHLPKADDGGCLASAAEKWVSPTYSSSVAPHIPRKSFICAGLTTRPCGLSAPHASTSESLPCPSFVLACISAVVHAEEPPRSTRKGLGRHMPSQQSTKAPLSQPRAVDDDRKAREPTHTSSHLLIHAVPAISALGCLTLFLHPCLHPHASSCHGLLLRSSRVRGSCFLRAFLRGYFGVRGFSGTAPREVREGAETEIGEV